MTRVRIDLRHPDPLTGVDRPVVGKVGLQPLGRRHIDAPTDGPDDYTLTGVELIYPLQDGALELLLEPTGEGEAWVVTEYVSGGTTRWVKVPDSADTLDYADLEDVTPPDASGNGTDDNTSDGSDNSAEMAELTNQVTTLAAQVIDLTDQVAILTTRTNTLTERADGLTGQTAALAQTDTTHTQRLDAQRDAIEQLASVAGTPATMRSVWRWTTNTTPTAGTVTATLDQVRIHATNAEGGDLTNVLNLIDTGATIYLQPHDDADAWRRWQVTATPTTDGSVHTIPVTTINGEGNAPRNKTNCAVAIALPPEAVPVEA